jgi:inosine-uridine nucleoside N-ribohydrolase
MSRGICANRAWPSLLAGTVGLVAALVGGCGGDTTVTTGPQTTGGAGTISATTTPALPEMGTPVVVDTDLALDSVMAILYLLGRSELDVVAITVSGTGEVHCEPGVRIAAGLVALAEAGEIPVACGPEAPLEGFNTFPTSWRVAADDAWGLELPDGGAPSGLPAPELLVSVIETEADPVVVFTDGPLTNLAAALRLDPGIAGNITMVYAMGGAIDVPGNTPRNPDAEYNIWVDPVAAAEVLASGVPLTLIPLDATNQLPLHAVHLRALEEHQSSPVGAAVVAMLEANSEFVTGGGGYFWDQLAAALLADETLASFETTRLAVITEGERDVAGRTVRGSNGAEVRVPITVDVERFEREFLSALAGEDVGPIESPTKTPAASMEALVTGLLAAAEDGNGDAWRALCSDDATQAVFLVTGESGSFVDEYAMAEWNPAATPLVDTAVVGAAAVSGDVATIPVRSTYQSGPARDVAGFAVIIGTRVEGGLLVAGGASFLAEVGAEADPTVAQTLIETQLAAWNADDLEGVLATLTDDLGAQVRETLEADAFGYQVEITGPPRLSGPFALVPNRLTEDTSGVGTDGFFVYWIQDGKIALFLPVQGY